MANTSNELEMLNVLLVGRKISGIGNDHSTARTFIFLDDKTILWIAYSEEQGAHIEYKKKGR